MPLRQDPGDLLQGTLGILILKSLLVGPAHGYAIARWVEDTTGDVLKIEEGSLYPALYRLEERGLLEAEWGVSELGRRAKFYRLTADGRDQLAMRTREWVTFADGVTRVLTGAPRPVRADG